MYRRFASRAGLTPTPFSGGLLHTRRTACAMWRFGSFTNEQGLIRNKADEALSGRRTRAAGLAGV
jgi:hypothetical protein